MSKSVMRTVLVISYDGENPDDIINQYAEESVVEPYLYMKKNEASEHKHKYETLLTEILKNRNLKLTSHQREQFKDRLWEIKALSVDDYFMSVTQGCTYKNGDAYSTKNPQAYFKYPKCYQKRLEITGEEAEFSNPFHLKDGTKAYQAHYDDIDWDYMHGRNKDLYRAAWELCVDGREPKDEQEQTIQERMSNRLDYFAQFKDKDAYANHSTSFFTYGIATNKRYIEVDYTISDMEWVGTYFDKYIKPLQGNPLLSIYEVRSLSD